MKMLHTILYWVVAVFLVAFAVSNRHTVEITLFPFGLAIETRLFLIMFCCIGLGYALGRARLIGMWWGNHRKLRALKRQVDALQTGVPKTTSQSIVTNNNTH